MYWPLIYASVFKDVKHSSFLAIFFKFVHPRCVLQIYSKA